MKQAEAAAAFDCLASQYDAWYTTPLGAFVNAREQELLFELIKVRLGEQALDVGCGTRNYILADVKQWSCIWNDWALSSPSLLGLCWWQALRKELEKGRNRVMGSKKMTQMTTTVEAVREQLAQGQPVTVLDIRKTTDRAEWSIPGSLHVDAYDALKANDPTALAAVDLPSDKPVVTVCGAGKVSLIAAEQLRNRGLTALSLEGGMKAWSLAWNSAAVDVTGSAAQVIQVRRTGKGCLSYLIGSNGVAGVIDPALEPEVYLSLARDNGWQITHIFDTHIHADHLSRARQLTAASGATLYLPAQERVAYPFHAIADGDLIDIGAVRLQVLHTPGHTLESVCYRLEDQTLFTGDTLFLAGVGRPDLEANATEARQRAHLLYHSLQRLLTLPASTLVLPGHTSAPVAFDGAALAAPLAALRHRVALLQKPEEEFVATLLARIPPTPPNHARIVAWNEGDQLFTGDPTELEAGANRCAVA